MGIKTPIRNLQRKTKRNNLFSQTINKMKTFAVALVAAASADKKVPPRHPLQRLNRLNEFAVEWCNDNLTEKQGANWSKRLDNNVARFESRCERCGYYDENNLPHGGPQRKRRDADDLLESCEDLESPLCRYDKNNAVRGIKQTTNHHHHQPPTHHPPPTTHHP